MSGFGGITKMQEMTSSICSKVTNGTEGRLYDTRDNKTYWVAKLRDGKCWMTQNLDLDLKAGQALTSADSDVASWTPNNDTVTGAASGFSGKGSLGNNEISSYDPGEFVYTASSQQNNCGSSGITKLEGCPNWKKIEDLSWIGGNDTQAHYLIGNYYSWGAATASQAASLASTTAGEQSTQSICPKGWMLPTGGSDGKQYNTLVNGLSVVQLTTSPYYFVYGGNVNNSSLVNAGNEGRYWSSTAYSDTHAYALYFSTSVNPSYSPYRYSGFSIRCVAK